MILKTLFKKIQFLASTLILIFSSFANLRAVVVSFCSGVNPIGRVHILKTVATTGVVTFDGWFPNLVVTAGKNHIADQLAEKDEAQMSHMAVGTGTAAAVPGDTALVTEIDRNALDAPGPTQGSGGDANKVTYICTWAAGDGTGALTEAGIFNSAGAGQMLCRSVFPVKNKEAGEQIVLTWVLTISS